MELLLCKRISKVKIKIINRSIRVVEHSLSTFYFCGASTCDTARAPNSSKLNCSTREPVVRCDGMSDSLKLYVYHVLFFCQLT